MTLYTEITEDRAGGTGDLLPVLSMGDLYLNDYPKPGEVHLAYPKAPIDLVWNQKSCLLQNKQTIDRSALYDEYWYVSGMNESMVRHLRGIVGYAKQFVKLKEGSVVLDIASNDGTLLTNYSEDLVRVGYDPAKNIEKVKAVGCINHEQMCFEGFHFQQKYQVARIITACAVIYHIPELVPFFIEVSDCLHPEGVLVVEFTYLPTMMRNNAVDSIGHEHVTHLSLKSLEPVLKVAGLEIVDARLGSMNAGTLLCAIKKSPCHEPVYGGNAFVAGLREYEWQFGLGRYETYLNWATGLEDLRNDLVGLLAELIDDEHTVYVYGASTKGSILLQWLQSSCGYPMNVVFEAAVERNPDKVGREMVGLKIPVISEEQARKENPDVLFVLPWHFKDEFTQREKDYLSNGGKMIFPLPQVEVVTG